MVGLLGEGVDYIEIGISVKLFCQANYGVMSIYKKDTVRKTKDVLFSRTRLARGLRFLTLLPIYNTLSLRAFFIVSLNFSALRLPPLNPWGLPTSGVLFCG